MSYAWPLRESRVRCASRRGARPVAHGPRRGPRGRALFCSRAGPRVEDKHAGFEKRLLPGGVHVLHYATLQAHRRLGGLGGEVAVWMNSHKALHELLQSFTYIFDKVCVVNDSSKNKHGFKYIFRV